MTRSSPGDQACPARLTLVGVVHLDPGGPGKLGRLLDRLRPDLITLQISPYAVKWRRRRSNRLRKILGENLALAAGRLDLDPDVAAAHGAIQAVGAQLEIPFEFTAARAYQRRFGGRIRLVDDSGLSRRRLDVLAQEVLGVDNLVCLLGSPDVSVAARCRGLWQRSQWGLEDSVAPEEESALAAAVARAHGRFNPGRHLHVCGFTHLNSLQRLLHRLDPISLRLD
jgi:hypothetical protein